MCPGEWDISTLWQCLLQLWLSRLGHVIQGFVLEALPMAWLITWELAQNGDSALKQVTVFLFSVSNLLPSFQLVASLVRERGQRGKVKET